MTPTAPPSPARTIFEILEQGKTWDRGVAAVDAALGHTYAAATNDRTEAYYGPESIAPPMLHVRLMRDLLFDVMEDPALGLDMLKLLHGEHDVTIHRPLRPGDLVHMRGRLSHVEQKYKGLVVEALLIGFVEGTAAIEARTLFFIRDQMVGEPGRGKRAPGPDQSAPDRPADRVLEWTVDADQSHRYGEASLDRNPIHIDPAVAQQAGLPDVILQGLCTMAMTGAGLIQHQLHGQAARLRRLSVRWTRPVFNGSKLATHVWQVSDTELRFTVLNADGQPVISHGVAELR